MDGPHAKRSQGCVGTASIIQQPEHLSFACLKNSEYDQEIPQSQTADKPMAQR